jgi:hypothetical protein
MQKSDHVQYIAIITYNRPALLERLIKSIRNLDKVENYSLIVIQQLGCPQVSEIIKRNQELFMAHIKTDPSDKATESKIASNRLTAYKLIFEKYRSDFGIVFEEDVILSRDLLHFFEMARERFRGDKHFMGINFGSIEPPTPDTEHIYFKQRFGIHGPASAISVNTWLQLKPMIHVLLEKFGHFDVGFEFFLRKGFMVSPARSRYLDLGTYGTHTGGQETGYFNAIDRSWLNFAKAEKPYEWKEGKPTIPFRDDCFLYSRRENCIFWLMWKSISVSDSALSTYLFKFIYRFYYLPKCRRNS